MKPELPIHFFTIVLNGDPFIRYHIEVLRALPFRWHWHIVEGVAKLKHDTAWSLENGGHIPDSLHCNGLSIDGTTEYLDDLAKEYPDNITIYRKPAGQFWNGKTEMVNAPLSTIEEEALLFQVDSDELWSSDQLQAIQKMFVAHPEKTAAWFWCWFFVGPKLVVSSRNCYSANPSYEWQRVWRFSPGDRWAAHEPPTLCNQQGQDLGRLNPFTHFDTEEHGLLFQHMSYVTEEQLQFKEEYYGYTDALTTWKALQKVQQYPVLLREYFPWVKDSTVAEPFKRFHVAPLAIKNNTSWEFATQQNTPSKIVEIESQPIPMSNGPRIAIDGVFFAEEHRGIARVWSALLEEWGKTSLGDQILLLDRNNTAPIIPGIKRKSIPTYNPAELSQDRALLERVCEEEQIDIFCSTYYTTPEKTPSLLLIHDMIPEVLGWDMNSHTDWQDKHRAIREASGFVAVSQNTKSDLLRFFPEISSKSVTVISNAYDTENFTPASAEALLNFHEKYQIDKPYFLLVGPRLDYKNAQFLFDALSIFPAQHGYGVFCTGEDPGVPQYGKARTGCEIYTGRLSDEELAIAYTGAVALVFPSTYEGFGLPLVEAMGCHCPIVAYPSGAVQEVGGDAALYARTPIALCSMLCEVQKPEVRRELIQNGIKRAAQFSWKRSAQQWMGIFERFAEGAQPSKTLSDQKNQAYSQLF